jgi:hypothetical protein
MLRKKPIFPHVVSSDEIAPREILLLEESWSKATDISQYRLRFGFSLLYKTVFYLNCLTAQLSYEGRAAVEGGK